MLDVDAPLLFPSKGRVETSLLCLIGQFLSVRSMDQELQCTCLGHAVKRADLDSSHTELRPQYQAGRNLLPDQQPQVGYNGSR